MKIVEKGQFGWLAKAARYAKRLRAVNELEQGLKEVKQAEPLLNIGWGPKQTIPVMHTSNLPITEFRLFNPLQYNSTGLVDLSQYAPFLENTTQNPLGIWFSTPLQPGHNSYRKPIKYAKARTVFNTRPYLITGNLELNKPLVTIGDVPSREALEWQGERMGADGIIFNNIYDNGLDNTTSIKSFVEPTDVVSTERTYVPIKIGSGRQTNTPEAGFYMDKLVPEIKATELNDLHKIRQLLQTGFTNFEDQLKAINNWHDANPDADFTFDPKLVKYTDSNGNTVLWYSVGNLGQPQTVKDIIDHLTETRFNKLKINPNNVGASWFDFPTRRFGSLKTKAEFLKNRHDILLILPEDNAFEGVAGAYLKANPFTDEDKILVVAGTEDIGYNNTKGVMLHEGYSHPTDEDILPLRNPTDIYNRTFKELYTNVSYPEDIINPTIINDVYKGSLAMQPFEARATNHELLRKIISTMSNIFNVPYSTILSKPETITRFIERAADDILTNKYWLVNGYMQLYQKLYKHPQLTDQQREMYKARFKEMLQNYLSIAGGATTAGVANYLTSQLNKPYYEQYKPGGKIKKRI